MNQVECSIILVQYNPEWSKVKRTLESILRQIGCKYEIIIADDGSKNDYFKKIRLLLEENNAPYFQFVKNQENVGTVKNIISGMKLAKGKYVRVISPGDMLYTDNTLQNIVDFMRANDAKEVFGKMKFYSYEKGVFCVYNNQVPFSYKPYIKYDNKRIKKNLLILGDNISGASYTWERKYYLDILLEISDKVIYLEDCVNAYTLYEGKQIYFMDEYVTWYEYGTGISTGQNAKWATVLAKDWIAFYGVMRAKFCEDRKLKRARLYYEMSLQNFWISKIFKNILFLERYLYSKIVNKRFKLIKREFLNECEIVKKCMN